MVNRVLSAVALSATIALSSGAARANLISDGNFSDPQNFYPVGYTLGGGAWTVITGQQDFGPLPQYTGVDVSQTDWQAPPGGGGSVDLDGYWSGGIFQTFATAVGAIYKVSFSLAGNPSTVDFDPPVKQLEVAAGSAIQDYSFDTSSTSDTDMGYVAESFLFTATSTVTSLAFVSLDEPFQASGPVIGGVDVELPEPASLALLLVGGLGIGMVRSRRPKTVAC